MGHRTCKLQWCVEGELQESCSWSLGCGEQPQDPGTEGGDGRRRRRRRLCSNVLGGGTPGTFCLRHRFVRLGAPLDGGLVYQSAQAGSYTAHITFSQSAGQTFKIKEQSGVVSGETSLPGLQTATFSLPSHRLSSVHTWRSTAPSYKDTSPCGLGPHPYALR